MVITCPATRSTPTRPSPSTPTEGRPAGGGSPSWADHLRAQRRHRRPLRLLGADLQSAFLRWTGEPLSSYDGTDGIQPRNNLAGINLSTAPKVFIECANMRNATDAALPTSLRWQA